MVQMPMSVLFRMFDRERKGAKALAMNFLHDKPTLGQTERLDKQLNCRQFDPRVDQRRQRHVAANAAGAVQVSDFHVWQFPDEWSFTGKRFEPAARRPARTIRFPSALILGNAAAREQRNRLR
jgi:hypothetical protein